MNRSKQKVPLKFVCSREQQRPGTTSTEFKIEIEHRHTENRKETTILILTIIKMGKRMHTSAVTFLFSSRSALLPANAITMLGLPVPATHKNNQLAENQVMGSSFLYALHFIAF